MRECEKGGAQSGHGAQQGSGLIGLLLVLVIAGFIVWFVVTSYLQSAETAMASGQAPLDETKQRTTVADMRAIAQALRLMQADTGSLPERLAELESGGYLVRVPPTDGWGNSWVYNRSGRGSFTLTSYGSDGRPGPAAPSEWRTGAYDVDIVARDGQLLQVPAGR